MNKRKQLSIKELREKQQEITKQLEQAEQMERAKIGKAVQKLTGLAAWTDINVKWQLIARDSEPNKAQEMEDDGIFQVKDPFHPEATK